MTVAIKHIEETRVRVEAGVASLEGNLRVPKEVVHPNPSGTADGRR
jgi:hypothetical protein